MCVELVVILALRGFSPSTSVFPSPKKNITKFQFEPNSTQENAQALPPLLTLNKLPVLYFTYVWRCAEIFPKISPPPPPPLRGFTLTGTSIFVASIVDGYRREKNTKRKQKRRRKSSASWLCCRTHTPRGL